MCVHTHVCDVCRLRARSRARTYVRVCVCVCVCVSRAARLRLRDATLRIYQYYFLQLIYYDAPRHAATRRGAAPSSALAATPKIARDHWTARVDVSASRRKADRTLSCVNLFEKHPLSSFRYSYVKERSFGKLFFRCISIFSRNLFSDLMQNDTMCRNTMIYQRWLTLIMHVCAYRFFYLYYIFLYCIFYIILYYLYILYIYFFRSAFILTD